MTTYIPLLRLVFFAAFASIFYFITAKKIIKTVAGIPPFSGDGKLAVNANLNFPTHMVQAPNREVYIADSKNRAIRKVDKYGLISTVAGVPGIMGYKDGPASEALFSIPVSISLTSTMDLIIADASNDAIRKVLSNGTVITIAGGNQSGSKGDGGLAIDAQLNLPNCAIVSPWNDNEIYICDTNNNAIRKILENGTMITVAGVLGKKGFKGDGGDAKDAWLQTPTSIAVTTKQEIYILDRKSCVIRKVFTNGTIATVIGTPNACNNYGDNGPASKAQLLSPAGVFISATSDDIYIPDSEACTIRKVSYSQNQTITTIAGLFLNCSYSGDVVPANLTTLNSPRSVFITTEEELFIADSGSNTIRKIDTNGIISSYAGKAYDSSTYQRSQLDSPSSVAISSSQRELYVSDYSTGVIKKIDQVTGDVTLVAGVIDASGYNGDQKIATEALLDGPLGLFLKEETQELYFVELFNKIVRKVNLQTAELITVAGSATIEPESGNSMEIVATNATFRAPADIFVTQNELYIADVGDNAIYKVFLQNGSMMTVAGDGGYVEVGAPNSIYYLEASNELFVAEQTTKSIRKIDTINRTISTLISWNNGQIPELTTLHSIFIKDEFLYWSSETGIFKVNLLNTSVIEIVAGNANSQYGFSGENRDPLYAMFNRVNDIAITSTNAIYAVDYSNRVVRKITNLCGHYEFPASWQFTPQQVYLSSNRKCMNTVDYFDAEYLPIVHFLYASNQQEFTSFVLNWNQSQNITNRMIASQNLELLHVVWDLCGSYQVKDSSCLLSHEWATIPSSNKNVLVFIPFITRVNFINYFKINKTQVSDFKIDVQFYNTNTNQTEKTLQVTDASTTGVMNLKHSTSYLVSMLTTVSYKNGLVLQSDLSTQLVKTNVGILPMSNSLALQVEIIDQTNAFIITWKKIPVEEQGNVPIQTLHLEWSQMNNEFVKEIILPYNAETNVPNSHTFSNVQVNTRYTIRARVCGEIGCSNYTSISDAMIREDISVSNTLSIVGITLGVISLILACVIFVAFAFILVLLVVTIYFVKKRGKFSKSSSSDESNRELVDMSFAKQFRIEESNLDFSKGTILGRGASGTVIKATYFNRDVAVKLVAKSIAGLDNDLSDFYNELQFLNKNAQHANIIRFFGVFESKTKNQIGLVMEFCGNGDVASYVSKQRSIPFEQKLQFIKGIAQGVQYLHHFGIAHRDLKCENVLLDHSLTPKIIDFGYSKVIAEGDNANLTMNIGTAAYCAPEVIKTMVSAPLVSEKNSNNRHSTNSLMEPLLSQLSDDLSTASETRQLAYDKKCDVYSFGMIIFVIYFQMKNPYGNVTDNQILYQLSINPSSRPKLPVEEELIPQQELWLVDLMKQCWSTNPADRPNFEQICAVLNKH